jgi:hypothetical protein
MVCVAVQRPRCYLGTIICSGNNDDGDDAQLATECVCNGGDNGMNGTWSCEDVPGTESQTSVLIVGQEEAEVRANKVSSP